ncbi:hypothetical protein SARC_03432 [Sphaeroforma arctica JP610]|uniref:Uncharacterized protein n=1 Tax=Sphaeroforma arctica JP610 TaxID=667725 RepID=A0A0L0G5P4_9EUKA|nr:hypothetical protein SARC_03432 [Sphaeroforma arctica JP610]KNC84352.1 hypothetical protein SARC_03432 [Sphaeroforma arctica JP610]|eukprot:XP_014158254.1 hypothetical protein SARC_03432 [Sphaeroforma arctica JP610]
MDQLPGDWSVTTNDYLPYNTRQCGNLEELTSAIKNGERVWLNDSLQDAPDMVKAVESSYFKPANCDIPYIQERSDICGILAKYSSVALLGDSLTRHLTQALMIQMTDDYVAGGTVVKTSAAQLHCKCDGLFSENAMCRGRNAIDLYDLFHEVCSDVQPLSRFDFMGASADGHPRRRVKAHADRIVCPDDDTRPVLIQLQGGLHVKSSAKRTISEIIQPLLENPKFKKCQEKGKVRLIWHAGSAQSRVLDKKYPHQSRENYLEFNKKIDEYLTENQVNVTILDWWKLSENAQMSDGVHYLQDVNVMKSNHFLTVASMLA